MISRKEADKISFENDLEDGGPSFLDKKLARAPKEFRKSLISGNPDSDEARSSAAIEIQRVYRGYRGRCNLFGTVKPDISKTAVYSGSQQHAVRVSQFDEELVLPPETDFIQQQYEEYLQSYHESGGDPSQVVQLEDFEANMQDWWTKQRSKPEPEPIHNPPSLLDPIPKPRSKLSERQAASIIQRAWRRHIDIQVYRYYRDLINFKSRGNPALMLRCINPNEAKLLDAASGVHVKFRLAGERFPPNIYYKIFTHRPVQDMCANSPKDYTRSEVKLKMAKDVHGNVRQLPGEDDKIDWYKRMDNNGWRLVSDRLIHHFSDPITWETSRKKYEFQHSKYQRIEDVKKRKKQRKIEWMQKLYRDGMLKAKSDDPETVNLIEGAAAGMVATVEKMGPNALEEWEVDELLDWTTSLNFDEYLNNWKDIATSTYSEKQVDDDWLTTLHAEEKMRLRNGTVDPIDFSISTGPASRFQSAQHSRNTPASSLSGQGHVKVNS